MTALVPALLEELHRFAAAVDARSCVRAASAVRTVGKGDVCVRLVELLSEDRFIAAQLHQRIADEELEPNAVRLALSEGLGTGHPQLNGDHQDLAEALFHVVWYF